MFRLPSAWNIQHSSSDECEFSLCEDETGERAETNRIVAVDNFVKGHKFTGESALNVTSTTTVQRKRPSSKLGDTLDDSDIETSPRPQVNHQSRATNMVVPAKAGLISARSHLPSSIKPAHTSASSIEEIEVDSPVQVDSLLLSKKTIPTSSSGTTNGWMKSIPDSVLQQYSGNSRNTRAKPNARTAESVLVRQLHAAVQRNRETLNSTNHLLNSQNLSASHIRECILLSVVSCEPCHLPVFPVRVNFCHRKCSNFLPSQSKATCDIHPFFV